LQSDFGRGGLNLSGSQRSAANLQPGQLDAARPRMADSATGDLDAKQPRGGGGEVTTVGSRVSLQSPEPQTDRRKQAERQKCEPHPPEPRD